MNAQNTTSVVNLIPAQPAKSAPASGTSNGDTPRFAEVLGNQRNQQAASGAGKASSTTSSANASQGNASGRSPDTNNAGVSESTEHAKATDTSATDAALAGEGVPFNDTALAMSHLALAVAQVHLARSQPGQQAVEDTDSHGIRLAPASLTNTDTNAPNGLAPSESSGPAGRLNDANLVTQSRQASAELVVPGAALAQAQSQGNPDSPVKDAVLLAQAAREPGKTAPNQSLANLNQRAENLDRQVRLNANARGFLADKATAAGAGPTFENNLSRAQAALTTGGARTAAPQAGSDTLPLTPLVASNDAASSAIPFTLNTASATAASSSVNTPLGHPQWGNDFSQQVSSISQSVKSGLQSIEIRLDPPDLGPIRISLSINDGVAQALFVSPHAAVRSAVENALPQLQQQLAQAGISLGQTSVSDQGQAQQQGNGTEQAGNARNNSLASTGAVSENAGLASASRAQSGHNGQIDTFA